MSKKIIFCLIFIGFFGLNSCSNPDEDTHPYYKFDSYDANLITKYNYTIGQIITYENQFGEQIHFRVLSNESKKLSDYSSGTFSGGGGILESYYDSKIIRLEIIENQANWPMEQVIYVFSKSKNAFKNGINFPVWNFIDYAFIDENDRPYTIDLRIYNNNTKTQININGHLFDKVVIIESGSSTSIANGWGGGQLVKNVNKLYYDYDFGIIQFNDVNGKEWKVIYPQ